MGDGEDGLRDAESHFAFGENWASYSKGIGPEELAEAERGLLQLVPSDELNESSFLDIGCGSGIHSLAACHLGVRSLLAIDLDTQSVDTAERLLRENGVQDRCTVRTQSVFELDPAEDGEFDIVYSWGVLHHTGGMNEAIRCAASMVRPGGLLVIAIYRRTRLDGFWRAEKRWYSQASSRQQELARKIFIWLFGLALRLKGRNLSSYSAAYRTGRGMDYEHDVHDWLGGYPYESALESDIEALLRPLGFFPVLAKCRGMIVGVFGSGCDEYVYRRPVVASDPSSAPSADA